VPLGEILPALHLATRLPSVVDDFVLESDVDDSKEVAVNEHVSP
jgi:hypothetical protein